MLIREGVADASRSQGRVPGGPEVSGWAAGGVLLPGVEEESMDGVRHGCERSVVSEQRAAMSGTSMNWLHSRSCCRLRRSPDLRVRLLPALPVVAPAWLGPSRVS